MKIKNCLIFILLCMVIASPNKCNNETEDPYADSVYLFTPGVGGGFGENKYPEIVLGPPKGGGDKMGSSDVLSLGTGGEIILEFTNNCIVDGEGDDFVIYENPFYIGGDPNKRYMDVGIVSVSEDGKTFFQIPYKIDDSFPLDNPNRYIGLAGIEPVYPGEGPEGIGGDYFDLADVGLSRAKYIKITDPGNLIEDSGNQTESEPTKGFDLDAVAALNSGLPY